MAKISFFRSKNVGFFNSKLGQAADTNQTINWLRSYLGHQCTIVVGESVKTKKVFHDMKYHWKVMKNNICRKYIKVKCKTTTIWLKKTGGCSVAKLALELELELEIYIFQLVLHFIKYNFISHMLNTRCSELPWWMQFI